MRAETAAMIMMSGSADLEDITITENGEYESVDHDGFDVVTVEVETYWDEYQQALQQISDLEDALEDCHDCRDAVVAALQRYDPSYDPAEGECPSDKVGDVVDDVEACHDCKDAVVAAMQAIDPDYVLPASGCPDDIPQKAYEKGEEDAPEKYTFEPNPDDPDFPDDIMVIANGADVTDETTGVSLGVEITLDEQNRGTAYPYYMSGGTKYYMGGVSAGFVSYWGEHNIKVIDPTTGEYSGGARAYWTYGGSTWYPFGGTQAALIGYGDPTHSYTVSKNS